MKPTYTRLFVGLLMAGGMTAASHAASLTIDCGATANDVQNCLPYAEDWAKKTGNTVKAYTAPTSSTDKLALLRQQFAAKSPDIDVLTIDVVWPGVIKDHLVDLKKYSKGAESKYFPAMIANNSSGGKLLGLPWFTDAGLLFYRKDLLDKYKIATPQTWDELSAAAKKVMDGEKGDLQGFVFQAKAYEGLTCDAIEWVYSFGGGTIIDKQGNITINNAKAAKALDTAATWIGTIAPGGVLNYGEEDARGVFQNGKAVFMRNWPYAWNLAQEKDSVIKDKVGVAALPSGGSGKAAAMGGWGLAVSKYSKNVDAAADLVVYLASAEVQKKRAINGSYNPTMPELYKDADVVKANPFMGQLLEVFTSAVARPATETGLKYPQVSNAFWDAAHDVLEKKSNGTDAVKKLEAKLKQIKRDKW